MVEQICSPSTCDMHRSCRPPSFDLPCKAHPPLQFFLLLIFILEQQSLIGERALWTGPSVAKQQRTFVAAFSLLVFLLGLFQKVNDEALTTRTTHLSCTSSVVQHWSGFHRFGGVFLASKNIEHKLWLSDCVVTFILIKMIETQLVSLKYYLFWIYSTPLHNCWAPYDPCESRFLYRTCFSPDYCIYINSFDRVKRFIRFCICPNFELWEATSSTSL